MTPFSPPHYISCLLPPPTLTLSPCLSLHCQELHFAHSSHFLHPNLLILWDLGEQGPIYTSTKPKNLVELNLVGAVGQRGPPTHDDWLYAREFNVFLKHFYDLTNKVSSTKYITSNVFFEE